MALWPLAEAFDVAPVTLVRGIVFNGYVSAKDRATDKPVRPLVLSVQAMRDAFAEIVLDEPELDPKACLTGSLNALISPHPYDLEPVAPVLKFDLSKYKFVEEMDVTADLDSRPNLLALTPGEFEHLTRKLFEAMGMKSWRPRIPRTTASMRSRSTRTRSSAACASSRPSATARSSGLRLCTRWLVSWMVRTPPRASWSPCSARSQDALRRRDIPGQPGTRAGPVELAGRGGGRLDALFLDEGFGSLDANSLADALDALGRQADTGRLVAVISHIRSVAETMDRVLAITASLEGSTARWLGGTECDELVVEDIEAGLLT